MSILITGGAGYIGSHTCVEVYNAGHIVRVFENYYNYNYNYNPKFLNRVEPFICKTLTGVQDYVPDHAALEATLAPAAPRLSSTLRGSRRWASRPSIRSGTAITCWTSDDR